MTTPRPPQTPIPAGFRIALDATTRQLDVRTWIGGSPARMLRLTTAGLRAWRELREGPVVSRAAGVLARKFTDAGLAHPIPPMQSGLDATAAEFTAADVTVAIPVRDRPDLLDRCLAAVGGRHPVVIVDDGSRDPAAVAAVADRHGAKLLRRDRNGGPGPARNTALDRVDSEIIAFLDSDCEPNENWIEKLVPHLVDPQVAAVAPRVVGMAAPTWSGRYTMANGSLDLGDRPASVAPGARVAYVPTAALLVRRSALLDIAGSGPVFDPALRFGEDVDLIWRLHHAGWRIRYDPAVRVRHREPAGWPALLRRRFRYGTSAAALARRHPNAVPPLVLPSPRALRGLLDGRLPARLAVSWGLSVALHTWLGLGRYGAQFALPALVPLALYGGRTRRLIVGSLLIGPGLHTWLTRRPALDPVRFTLGHLADDAAYGLGVLTGCARERTTIPLRPTIK